MNKPPVLTVIAGRPVRRFEETHRTAPQISFALILEVLGAITFAVILLTLYGCGDGEYERKQSEAEWNAKVARACLPRSTETLVNVRHMGDGYIFRRYAPFGSKQPYLSTDVIARNEQ